MRHVDKRKERVVPGGDNHISRKEVPQRYRSLKPILGRGFRAEEGVFLRCSSLSLSAKELLNGLRRGVGLLGRSIINLVEYKMGGIPNLLEKEKGHDPSNDRESRGHSTREEIRVLFQKSVVAERVGEPFRWTRKSPPIMGLFQTCKVVFRQTQHFGQVRGVTVAHPKVVPADQAIGSYE